MRVEEISSYVDEELTYPIERDAVIERIGEVEVAAPDEADTETIATILGSLGPETYSSADELYNTIIGNVGEEHIGRKYYDDRGQNDMHSTGGPQEERDISF